MKTALISIACLVASTAAVVAQSTPKAEVFLGYTYTRFNSGTNVPAFSSNGGTGQFVLNLGKYVGAVADVGSVHNGNVGGYQLDTTVTNFLFGPRFPIRNGSRVTPYFQALWGGVYGSTSTRVNVPPALVGTIPPPVSGATVTGNAVALRAASQQTAFAQAYGGGIDIRISKSVTFRPIGVDYYMTRLQNLRSTTDNNQHNIRYTTGFNFTFGGEVPAPPPPPPPPMKTCWNGSSIPAADDCPMRVMTLNLASPQAQICPGAAVTLVPSGEIPEGAAIEWTVNGQPISKGRSFEFGGTGRDPGSYRIGLKASAADYNEATLSTSVEVLSYAPPTGSVQVSPSEIWAGEQATVAADFAPGRCGGQIQSTEITASEGSVSGGRFDSSSVQFDASDASEQRKTVTLQAKAVDEHSTGTAQGTIVVKKRGAVLATRLPDLIFPANSARVNNCGKRVLLEDLKSYLEKDPGGKVVFVGHVSPDEASRPELDRKRALNAAAVITAGQGICGSFPANQILVSAVGAADNGVDLQPHFCGTSAAPRSSERPGQAVKESEEAKLRRVEVWFVPAAGALPASLKENQDAAALSVSSIGCPR